VNFSRFPQTKANHAPLVGARTEKCYQRAGYVSTETGTHGRLAASRRQPIIAVKPTHVDNKHAPRSPTSEMCHSCTNRARTETRGHKTLTRPPHFSYAPLLHLTNAGCRNSRISLHSPCPFANAQSRKDLLRTLSPKDRRPTAPQIPSFGTHTPTNGFTACFPVSGTAPKFWK
jgi:hypothetical protein